MKNGTIPFYDTVQFTWLDYTLFIIMLIISALIGVYFGFFGKKQNSRAQYIYGGNKMKIFPVAASLVATEISGINLLGLPSEIYMYGCAYWLSNISAIITFFCIGYIFLPVFYKLKVNTNFEYLKLRYDNSVCIVASSIFALTVILFLPLVIYTPALAFSQVTGVNLNIIIPIVCLVCIFYTTLGGIKAVVWTDTVQMMIMLISLLTVFVLGVVKEGGFVNIWEKNEMGGRIDFNLDPDPTRRTSSFAIVIGLTVFMCGYGSNPVYVQRLLSVRSFEHAKKTLIIYGCGSMLFKIFSVYYGLLIHARYYDCDPIESGSIAKPDQILPYYVMDVASSIPGLPGLFIAGIFCASLSTMSSGLNTMSGTIYEDFISAHMPNNTTEKRASDIMKLISVCLGLMSMALVFLVQHLGTIMQLTLNIAGLAAGPLLSMFMLGMLVPSVNTKGILYGSVIGMCVVAWVMSGAIYYSATGKIKSQRLPSSIEGCDFPVNFTIPTQNTTFTDENSDQPLYVYRITFYYYALIGAAVTTAIAVPLSCLTGGRTQVIDRDLLNPLVYPIISKRHHEGKIATIRELEALKL